VVDIDWTKDSIGEDCESSSGIGDASAFGIDDVIRDRIKSIDSVFI
jgi:hypothetical protein